MVAPPFAFLDEVAWALIASGAAGLAGLVRLQLARWRERVSVRRSHAGTSVRIVSPSDHARGRTSAADDDLTGTVDHLVERLEEREPQPKTPSAETEVEVRTRASGGAANVRLAMQVVISLILLAFALVVLITEDFSSSTENVASGLIGSIVGFWLASQST